MTRHRTTMMAITRRTWMMAPTLNANAPSAQRIKRIIAMVNNMSGTPGCDWRASGPLPIESARCGRSATEIDANRSHVVSHIDHEDREIADAPQGTGKNNQATGLTQQGGDRRTSLSRQPRHDFRDEKEEQNDRDEAKQLRQVPEANIRLEIRGPNARYLRLIVVLLFDLFDGSCPALLCSQFTDEIARTPVLGHYPPPDPVQRAR